MNNEDYPYTEPEEDYYKTLRGGCITAIGAAITIAVVVLTLCLFSSCKHVEYVSVPQTHTDTLYIHQQQRDSIYLHDSTIVKMAADTVIVEKWHTRYVEKLSRDTVNHIRIDSVAYPIIQEKVVEVPAKPSLWQKLTSALGVILLFALFTYGAIRIRRYLP